MIHVHCKKFQEIPKSKKQKEKKYKSPYSEHLGYAFPNMTSCLYKDKRKDTLQD